MSEHLNLTIAVEAAYIQAQSYDTFGPEIHPEEARRKFREWLAQVRQEAKVEALREEADALETEKGPTLRDALMIQRLHYRADQLEQAGEGDE